MLIKIYTGAGSSGKKRPTSAPRERGLDNYLLNTSWLPDPGRGGQLASHATSEWSYYPYTFQPVVVFILCNMMKYASTGDTILMKHHAHPSAPVFQPEACCITSLPPCAVAHNLALDGDLLDDGDDGDVLAQAWSQIKVDVGVQTDDLLAEGNGEEAGAGAGGTAGVLGEASIAGAGARISMAGGHRMSIAGGKGPAPGPVGMAALTKITGGVEPTQMQKFLDKSKHGLTEYKEGIRDATYLLAKTMRAKDRLEKLGEFKALLQAVQKRLQHRIERGGELVAGLGAGGGGDENPLSTKLHDMLGVMDDITAQMTQLEQTISIATPEHIEASPLPSLSSMFQELSRAGDVLLLQQTRATSGAVMGPSGCTPAGLAAARSEVSALTEAVAQLGALMGAVCGMMGLAEQLIPDPTAPGEPMPPGLAPEPTSPPPTCIAPELTVMAGEVVSRCMKRLGAVAAALQEMQQLLGPEGASRPIGNKLQQPLKTIFKEILKLVLGLMEGVEYVHQRLLNSGRQWAVQAAAVLVDVGVTAGLTAVVNHIDAVLDSLDDLYGLPSSNEGMRNKQALMTLWTMLPVLQVRSRPAVLL